MQHRFENLTLKFGLSKLRNFKAQQPAELVGDGETRVLLETYSMRMGAINEACRNWSSLLLFHKTHYGAVSIEKDAFSTPAHSLDLPGYHSVLIFVDTVMP